MLYYYPSDIVFFADFMSYAQVGFWIINFRLIDSGGAEREQQVVFLNIVSEDFYFYDDQSFALPLRDRFYFFLLTQLHEYQTTTQTLAMS